MKIKLIFSTACLLMALFANNVMAVDFTVANNGQNIHYNIISNTSTVEVTTTGNIDYSGDVEIPDTVTNNGITYTVTAIGAGAFHGCTGLTSITLPNTITVIRNTAFYGCTGLTTVTVPNSVTTIESSAFFGCNKLTSVTIGNSVTTIGQNAFSGCSKLSGTLTIPNSVTTIGNSAFSGCIGLTDITIGDSVTTIGDRCFMRCSKITTITIPSSVTTVGRGIFVECSKLTSIDVDVNNADFSSIDGVLFDKAQTQLIQYPASKSGYYVIPNTVTTIAEDAFYMCFDLTAVAIPNLVTTIKDMAFLDCTELKDIYVKTTTPPQIQANTFDGVPYNTVNVYVCSSINNYKTDPNWGAFKNIIEDCGAAIEDILVSREIAIYPNPVQDDIRITLPENVHQAVFTLYDMQGKVLITQNITHQDAISLNKLASGIYIYNVRTDKQQYLGKISK